MSAAHGRQSHRALPSLGRGGLFLNNPRLTWNPLPGLRNAAWEAEPWRGQIAGIINLGAPMAQAPKDPTERRRIPPASSRASASRPRSQSCDRPLTAGCNRVRALLIRGQSCPRSCRRRLYAPRSRIPRRASRPLFSWVRNRHEIPATSLWRETSSAPMGQECNARLAQPAGGSNRRRVRATP